MSAVKQFLIEYLESGGEFRYKEHAEIPSFMINLIEDYCDGSYKKIPIEIINRFLNDFMEDLMEENETTISQVVYTDGPYGKIDVEGRREQFATYLREGTVTVGFTKKDGEDRRMNCTLINIPADKQPKGDAPERKGTSMAVFDVDKQDWRSFNLENVFELIVNGNPIFQTVGK